MERSVVMERLSASLRDIFAFSASRLFDKQDAEDLTNDIIVEVLASVDRLQNDEAFYGYLWKIAENTFKKYLRQKRGKPIEFSESFLGAFWDTPENKLIEDEELALLRRELSLLSKQYRDVTIMYYIENKTCPSIAEELCISEEMVKYYLFKTRKILKEGVTMNRKYGEKSYNPSKFSIDFWGNGSNAYIWDTFSRKLPGNIVLAAYEMPLSIEELSLELGVSAPYLEDELEILLNHQFIRKVGNKYQTDILIFRTPYEEEFRETVPTSDICTQTAEFIKQCVETKLPLFKTKDLGVALDNNQLRWFMVNFALLNALGEFEGKTKERFGKYPQLTSNTYGFVFGHDNDYTYGYFNGIYGHCDARDNMAWYSAVNYNAIQSCQWWRGASEARSTALCDAILQRPLNGRNSEAVASLVSQGYVKVDEASLHAEFPTFTSRNNHEMKKELKEIMDRTVQCMETICCSASQIFKKHTPTLLRDHCEQLCYVRHQADAMGIIVEKLIEDGYLIVPNQRTNLTMYGVKRLSE